MKIKMETLRKFLRLAKETKREYSEMDPKDIKITISPGNIKIGRVLNVSLLPIATCSHCKECKRYCYDVRDCLRFPGNVLRARVKNTVLMERDMPEYFRQIDNRLTRRRKNKAFRWHVGGDIPNMEYFERMIETARNHPDFRMWTYTKEYDIVNEYVRTHGDDRKIAIPENLAIMFSEWDGVPIDNPYDFPVFSTRLTGGNKNHSDDYFEGLHKCPGTCKTCLESGRGCPFGESTYNDEH